MWNLLIMGEKNQKIFPLPERGKSAKFIDWEAEPHPPPPQNSSIHCKKKVTKFLIGHEKDIVNFVN